MAFVRKTGAGVVLSSCDDLQEEALKAAEHKTEAAGILAQHPGKRVFKVKKAGAKIANGLYVESGIFAKRPQYKSANGFELFCNFKGLWTIGKVGMSYYVNPNAASDPPQKGWSMETGKNMMTTRGKKPCPTVKEVKEKAKKPDVRIADGPKAMWATELVPLMNMPNATLGRKLRDVAEDQFVKATHTMGAFYKVKKPQVGYILKEKLTDEPPNDDERDRSVSSEPPTDPDQSSSEEEEADEPADRRKSLSRKRSRSPRRRRSPIRRRRREKSGSPSSDDGAKGGDPKQKAKMLNMSLDDLNRNEARESRRRSPPRRRRSRSRDRRKRRSRSRSRKRRRSRSKEKSKKKRSRSRSRKRRR